MTKGMGKAYGEDIRRQLGPRGQASGLICPKCQGGQSRERSVSAWHQGLTITAKCWRNACGFRGTWDATTGMGLGYQAPAGGDGRTGFRVDTLPLDSWMVAFLDGRYRIREPALRHWGVRQYPGRGGVYVPCNSPTGLSRGWVLRRIDGSTPKVLSYPTHGHTHEPWQAWFPSTPGGLVVCVEDVFSAMRLWQAGTNAVAMLGVSLSDMKAAEIGRHYDQVAVALDSDATARAIEAARRYNFVYRRLLGADLKDMTEEQLTQWTISLTSSLPASRPVGPIPS